MSNRSCPSCGATMILQRVGSDSKWTCLRCGFEPRDSYVSKTPSALPDFVGNIEQEGEKPELPQSHPDTPKNGLIVQRRKSSKGFKIVLAVIIAAIIIASMSGFYANLSGSFINPVNNHFPPPLISTTSSMTTRLSTTLLVSPTTSSSSSSVTDSSTITTQVISSSSTVLTTSTSSAITTSSSKTSSSSSKIISSTSTAKTTTTTSVLHPALALSPVSGLPGSRFTFTFNGGSPNTLYYLEGFSQTSVPFTTNLHGSYVGMETVPTSVPQGKYNIMIKDRGGIAIAGASFTVVKKMQSVINTAEFSAPSGLFLITILTLFPLAIYFKAQREPCSTIYLKSDSLRDTFSGSCAFPSLLFGIPFN